MSDTALDQLQGVNPLLSNMIAGVGGDQNFVADKVLPIVMSPGMNVTYRKGGNEHLVAEGSINTARPAGALPRESDISFSTGTVVLTEHALRAGIDYMEEAAASANEAAKLDIRMAKASALKSKVLLGKEQAVADVVFAAGNYTSRTSSAVNFGSTGIRETVLNAKDTVRKLAGYAPNKLVLGATSIIKLLGNADLKTIFDNGGTVRMPNLSDLAMYFGVDEIVEATAVKQTTAAAGDAGTGSYVWTADSAALIYVNDKAASPWNPSFGYLFQKQYATGGTELVVTWKNDPFVENLAYGQCYAPAVTFTKAGYLWTNTDQV